MPKRERDSGTAEGSGRASQRRSVAPENENSFTDDEEDVKSSKDFNTPGMRRLIESLTRDLATLRATDKLANPTVPKVAKSQAEIAAASDESLLRFLVKGHSLVLRSGFIGWSTPNKGGRTFFKLSENGRELEKTHEWESISFDKVFLKMVDVGTPYGVVQGTLPLYGYLCYGAGREHWGRDIEAYYRAIARKEDVLYCNSHEAKSVSNGVDEQRQLMEENERMLKFAYTEMDNEDKDALIHESRIRYAGETALNVMTEANDKPSRGLNVFFLDQVVDEQMIGEDLLFALYSVIGVDCSQPDRFFPRGEDHPVLHEYCDLVDNIIEPVSLSHIIRGQARIYTTKDWPRYPLTAWEDGAEPRGFWSKEKKEAVKKQAAERKKMQAPDATKKKNPKPSRGPKSERRGESAKYAEAKKKTVDAHDARMGQFQGDYDSPDCKAVTCDEIVHLVHGADPMTLAPADKAAPMSPVYSGSRSFKKEATNQWASDLLFIAKGNVTFTIPACLATGDYLLRVEDIGPSAATTVKPATTSIPGIYKSTDPGLVLSVYTVDSYTLPGPSVFTCPA
ncbi:hypothetical protein C8J56DRAFT_1019830 [Mycena floridula]|nr:hypothetical protein C8J56DRAFT_1019830 [Mycena floridula]